MRRSVRCGIVGAIVLVLAGGAAAVEVEATYDISASSVSLDYSSGSVPLGPASGTAKVRFQAPTISAAPNLSPVTLQSWDLEVQESTTMASGPIHALSLGDPLPGGALTSMGAAGFPSSLVMKVHCHPCYLHCVVTACGSWGVYSEQGSPTSSQVLTATKPMGSLSGSLFNFGPFAASIMTSSGGTAMFSIDIVGQEIGRTVIQPVPSLAPIGVAIAGIGTIVAGVWTLRRLVR